MPYHAYPTRTLNFVGLVLHVPEQHSILRVLFDRLGVQGCCSQIVFGLEGLIPLWAGKVGRVGAGREKPNVFRIAATSVQISLHQPIGDLHCTGPI